MMKYTVLILSLFFSVAGFGQGQMFLRATPAGGGPANLLLDDYPGATAAYAVMKLDNDYAGSCIRIRRSSDSAEQDIGFSGNDIDEASINSFCSGANCFVKTWYDQSGNGNDATQTTTANQPKVYDSLTGIIYESSVLALDFDGTDFLQSNTFTAVTQPFTRIGVALLTGVNYAQLFTGSSTNVLEFGRRTPGSGYYSKAGVELQGVAVMTDVRHLFGALYNGASSNIRIDGSVDKTGNAGTVSENRVTIGATNTGAYGTNGTIQLIISYPSDKTSDISAIETIINNYFSIY